MCLSTRNNTDEHKGGICEFGTTLFYPLTLRRAASGDQIKQANVACKCFGGWPGDHAAFFETIHPAPGEDKSMQGNICQDIDFGSAHELPALQRWVIFSLIISHRQEEVSLYA